MFPGNLSFAGRGKGPAIRGVRPGIPVTPLPLKLSDIDVTMEPEIRTRGWQLLGDTPFDSQTWSLEEHRQFLGQLAKMKFNRKFAPVVGGDSGIVCVATVAAGERADGASLARRVPPCVGEENRTEGTQDPALTGSITLISCIGEVS